MNHTLNFLGRKKQLSFDQGLDLHLGGMHTVYREIECTAQRAQRPWLGKASNLFILQTTQRFPWSCALQDQSQRSPGATHSSILTYLHVGLTAIHNTPAY